MIHILPNRFKHLALTTALLVSLSALPAKAENSFTDAQKEEIGAIMKEYLLENPGLIIEAMEAFRDQQRKEREELAKEKVKEHQEYLAGDDLPFVGNPDGDIIVVEFFDYNCGYCKRALPDVQAAMENDDVKVVFQEMPILGPSSLTAAKYALAAQNQGKYFEYHSALMEHRGQKTESTLAKIGSDLGLDVDQLKKDAESEAIQEKINKSVSVARDIGITGTPAFLVNDKLYPGYLGPEGMEQSIQTARDQKEG